MTAWNVIGDFFVNLFSFEQAHPLLFTQFYFWAFFAIVFAGMSLFRSKILLRNTFLFASSLFFYYKTSGLFLILLLFVIVYNYLAGRGLGKMKKGRKAVLVLSVIVDLSLLAYFKYAYFITDLVNNLFGTEFAVFDVFALVGNTITGEERFDIGNIFLPVGVSFFTFQAISYIVDIYRRKIAPVRNFFDFGFYLSFFPQLVAGPIVRATDFIGQLRKPFNLSRRWFGIAVFWIMNGLVKKIVLSDYIAVNFCDRVFENPLMYSGFENFCALFGYSLQVYADFSGYTDIAIGVAMLMGFYLPKNFNSPYKARNAGEFWKRWHISLSSWLKDYLYIPLGGNRNATPGTWICIFGIALIAVFLSGSVWVALVAGVLTIVIGMVAWLRPGTRRKIVTNINSMNTMLLGGLWHGASWNFMIWGGLNGLGMIIYKFWKGWNVYVRAGVTIGVTAAIWLIARYFPAPVWTLFLVWMLFITAGAIVHAAYHATGLKWQFKWLETAWAVTETFVFITFTRLFFRSGSNLDPAEANEKAWNTARNMVNQIGSAWDVSKIPEIAWQYRSVFITIVIGMIIHWLPERFKRRYRIWFSRMPIPVMVVVCFLIIFFFYQFITADLQSFIYFQF